MSFIAVDTKSPARVVFTTREGGVSEGAYRGLNLGAASGDRPEAVRANRAWLCSTLGLDRERVTMGYQVHGAEVRTVAAPTRPGRFTGGLRRWPAGDGLVTGVVGLPLVALGADCLTVAVWRDDGAAVGVVHAGWRGLLAGILEREVSELVGDPARVAAAIGPGVGPCCYPVDAALRERFAASFGAGVVTGASVDLAEAATVALRRAGIGGTAVSRVAACTACEATRFFSHRRDGAGTGRHGCVVWIASGST